MDLLSLPAFFAQLAYELNFEEGKNYEDECTNTTICRCIVLFGRFCIVIIYKSIRDRRCERETPATQ